MDNIAVNLLWVSTRDRTGAFVYVKNLLDQLFQLETQTTFWLIIRQHDQTFFQTHYQGKSNVRIYVCDIRQDLLRRPDRAIRKLWSKVKKNEAKLESLIAAELRVFNAKHQIRKMFFPSQMIYPQGLTNIKHYVTILDLQHEYLPKNFSAKELGNRKQKMAYICQTAHHLFAISEYTKQTLLEKYHWPTSQVTVTPLAPQETGAAPAAMDLPAKYIFYPAALWPHKNHRLVIKVLHELSSRHPDLHLVFSGLLKKASLKIELDTLIKNHHLTDRVHFLGLVSDGNLEYLYQKATLMIFPSAFEGFGMPLLEAYQHNLPVVAARNSSITEVAGEAAILCETNNQKEFAQAVDLLLKDSGIRDQLKTKGQKQLTNYSWQKTATLTLEQLQQ